MIRLLFVDDEQCILDGFGRAMRPLRRVWEIGFATDGVSALLMLASREFDGVVTDMRMPGMDGLTLLEEVKKHYPALLRIVLSGQSEMEAVVKSAGVAHLYLAKPCPLDELRVHIERAFSLRRLFAEPVLPKMLECIDSHIENGNERRCGPLSLVQLLLSGNTGCLCAGSWEFDMARTETRSTYAERIARKLSSNSDLHWQAKMSGLLMDVGQVLMRCHFANQYEKVDALVQQGANESDAEQVVFGISHAAFSAYILGQAALPDVVLETVAYHHSPSICPHPDNNALLAAHVADALVFGEEGAAGFDLEFMNKIGQMDKLGDWRTQVEPVIR